MRECPAGVRMGQQAPREVMSEHTGTRVADLGRGKGKHKGLGKL